jgi:hypothetical protein
MKWYVIIGGDRSILENLSQQDSNGTCSITKSENEYLLYLNEFENYTTIEEIKRITDEYVDTLNGILFLQEDIPSALKIHSFFKINDRGGRDIFITPEPAIIHLRGYAPTIIVTKDTGETIVNSPYQQTIKTLLNSKSNPSLEKIFNLIKNGDFEFPTLYKIIEILLSQKGSKLYQWVSKVKIRLLKQTASYETRHAVNDVAPPPRPMKISEAREITRHLIRQYVAELNT